MATLAAAIPPKPEPLKDSYKIGSEFSSRSSYLMEEYGLEIGDEFYLPKSFVVYSQDINDKPIDFIYVKLSNGLTKKFYPCVLFKSRILYTVDGYSTGKRVFTKGSAADLFRKQGNVQKGMEALKGKTLRVTNIEYIRTQRNGTTCLMMTAIPTIDIIE